MCQCGHLFDLEMVKSGLFTYFKAKCRPTMQKDPLFYCLFIKLETASGKPVAGNCKCPAGATQSCVHVAALLITLSEVTPQACTSMRRAWLRPTQSGKPSLATDLDFGKSSSNGYIAYTGPILRVDDLLQQLESVGCDVGVQHYCNQEAERYQQATLPPSLNPVLIDPIDKLGEIAATHDVTVNDLVDALKPTAEGRGAVDTKYERWSEEQSNMVRCKTMAGNIQVISAKYATEHLGNVPPFIGEIRSRRLWHSGL